MPFFISSSLFPAFFMVRPVALNRKGFGWQGVRHARTVERMNNLLGLVVTVLVIVLLVVLIMALV